MVRTYLEDGGGPVVSPSLPIRGPVLAGRFHPEGVLRPLLSDIVVSVQWRGTPNTSTIMTTRPRALYSL